MPGTNPFILLKIVQPCELFGNSFPDGFWVIFGYSLQSNQVIFTRLGLEFSKPTSPARIEIILKNMPAYKLAGKQLILR